MNTDDNNRYAHLYTLLAATASRPGSPSVLALHESRSQHPGIVRRLVRALAGLRRRKLSP
jgi:hypothetical protein